MIGVVGGMGPYAGLDLVQKIFNETNAETDQDHLPVSIISMPHTIEDRTKFLLDSSSKNPGISISKIVNLLVKQGATIIGMPCNTAHAPKIFNEIENRISKNIIFIHMIREVVQLIKTKHSKISKVGILATTGTLTSKIYDHELIKNELIPITLSEKKQREWVDISIYDLEFGIKSHSNPVTIKAKQKLELGIGSLINSGAEAIILGCTEIPLAIPENMYQNIPLIDSTKILARALILEASPQSIKE